MNDGHYILASTIIPISCTPKATVEFELSVYWRTGKTRDAYIAEMKPLYVNVAKIVPMKNTKDTFEGADIVVTTTPSREPIVSNDWVKLGMHFNRIGANAPGKQELDPAILSKQKSLLTIGNKHLTAAKLTFH
jgi:ornithine cyclodeaminase/alanine dehydrogenase-like protein (mu-crystallin family)